MKMKTKNLTIILIFFKFIITSDGFLLHGSAGPLTARLGGAVLLPCFVDRPLPLEELQVDWRRTDSDTIVHLFQEGQSRPDSQGDAYRDRAHFFTQEIPKGNFSVLLEGVRAADAGVYECVVYTEQEQNETRVEIQEVERLVVMGVDKPVSAHAGEDVTLSCSVDTHVNVTELQVEWRKTDGDIMVLLFTDGENKLDSQHDRYSGRAEFFTEEIPKGNFSMKLRKVRLEDKGKFMCEVHSDTDSASTTARIAALGYSSLHWLILGLCITVIPAVLLTGAFSVRYYIKKSKGRQALLSHWSLVTVPPVLVSSAFILWGVNEGSTDEAVTCTVITLLSIMMLFFMDPKRLYPDVSSDNIFLARTIGTTIIIIAVCTVPIIEFSTNYSATTAGKITLGVFIGGFVLMMVFMASMQFLFLWYFNSSLSWSTFKKILLAISGFLIIMVLATIGVGVFLATYFSGRAEIAGIGPFLTVFIAPVIMFLITFAVTAVAAWRSSYGFYTFWESLNMIFNMQILTLYIQLIAWMQDRFLLGYFIPITVASLGICACFAAKRFLQTFRHFYLAQKILLGILFSLHLILSLLYLSLVLDNDKVLTTERLVKICEFVFIYILIVTNNDDWLRDEHLAKSRKCVYFSGAFGLPLLNSAALAVALILKADTGKQPLDLRLIVLISGSVFLFIWFVIQMSAYYLSRKRNIKEAFTQIKDPDPDQPELIEERLRLLKHAEECQRKKQDSSLWKYWRCSRPHCAAMRKVLKHMTHCQAGTSCQVKHCASSRRIISEWEEGYIWSYKPELIQERLELLKHADECRWDEQHYRECWSCSRPHCAAMREVLKHIKEDPNCEAGTSCQVKHCAYSRWIISENKDYEWHYIKSHGNQEMEVGPDLPDSCGSDVEEESCASEETVALSPPDPNGPNTEEGPHDDQEIKALLPADHNGPNTEGSRTNEETVALAPPDPNGPNTEEGSHDDQEMEPLSPADHNEPNTEVTEERSTEF